MGSSRPRIALVLAAGGPVGHAFHAGVLSGLSTLGWDARTADLVVGTSAGAQVAALLRAGVPPRDLVHRVCGTPMSESGGAIARHFIRPDYRIPVHPRRLRPAAPSYLARNVLRPWMWHIGRFFAAALPPGRVCLAPQINGFRNIFGTEWANEPLWVTALSVTTGNRVVFGRPGAPRTCVGTAVACSGAVPSVCRPLPVEDQTYVDGGMVCLTHLDLLDTSEFDTVVVSSPLSMFRPLRWLFHHQIRRLERRGMNVIALEPDARLRRHMGNNPMKLSRAPAVAIGAETMMTATDARTRDGVLRYLLR